MNLNLTHPKRIYILPTRSGLVLSAVLLAMLVAAINYNNSLAYMLCFLVTSLALVSMVHTHYNLAGLSLQTGDPTPAFAGGAVRVSIAVANRSARTRYAVHLEPKGIAPAGPGVTIPSIAGESTVHQEFSIPAQCRGRHALPSMTVSSRYPLGLFRAWFWEPLQREYLVYPRPYGPYPWPAPMAAEGMQEEGDAVGGDDFMGVRAYQSGDSHRHVDWKAVARGRPLLVKQFAGGGRGRVCFDWSALGGLEPEARLSQLARWVVEASRQGCDYGLRLPHQEYPPASGWQHYHTCLAALALFPAER